MIKQSEFHAIIRAVAHSASSDKTRPALNSILFELLEGSMRIVSTDGHRLTVATLNTRIGTGSFIAPLADIKELLGIFKHKSDKRIVFSIHEGVLMVTNNKATLRIEAMADGTYPDYQQVLPPDDTGAVGVTRFASKYLTQAVKACDGLIDSAGGIDIITSAPVVGAMPPPSIFRPVLDPDLEVLQSLDIYITPQQREGC